MKRTTTAQAGVCYGCGKPASESRPVKLYGGTCYGQYHADCHARAVAVRERQLAQDAARYGR